MTQATLKQPSSFPELENVDAIRSLPVVTLATIEGDTFAVVTNNAAEILYYQNTGTAFSKITNPAENPFSTIDVQHVITYTENKLDPNDNVVKNLEVAKPFPGGAVDFADLNGDGHLDLFMISYTNISYFEFSLSNDKPVYGTLDSNGRSQPTAQAEITPRYPNIVVGIDGDRESQRQQVDQESRSALFDIILEPIAGNLFIEHDVPRFVDINGDKWEDLFIGRNGQIDYYYNVSPKNVGVIEDPDDIEFEPGSDLFFDQDDTPFEFDLGLGRNLVVPSFFKFSRPDVYDAFVGHDNGTILYFKNIGTEIAPKFQIQEGTNNPFNEFNIDNIGSNKRIAPYLVDLNGVPVAFVTEHKNGEVLHFELERPPIPIGSLTLNSSNQFVFGNTGTGNVGNNLKFDILGKPASQIANIKIQIIGGDTEKLFSILPGGFIPNGFPPPSTVIVDFPAENNLKPQNLLTGGSKFLISVELFGKEGTTVVNFDSISGGSGVWQLRSTRPELGDLRITLSQTDTIPNNNNGLGVGVAQSQGLAVFELESKAFGKFTVYREASFTNQIGLYKVTDALTGAIGSLLPGSAGYAQAAVRSAQGLGFGLSVANQSVGDGGVTLEAGKYVPFIIVNGTFDSFLSSNPDNASGGIQAYFPFLNANPDGQIHAMVLGNNTFGFEDLFGGGDFDYNDLIVQVDFA